MSFFLLQKLDYNNSIIHDQKVDEQLHKTKDDKKDDNADFFDRWENLRNGIIEDDFQQEFYQVVSEEEMKKNNNKI